VGLLPSAKQFSRCSKRYSLETPADQTILSAAITTSLAIGSCSQRGIPALAFAKCTAQFYMFLATAAHGRHTSSKKNSLENQSILADNPTHYLCVLQQPSYSAHKLQASGRCLLRLWQNPRLLKTIKTLPLQSSQPTGCMRYPQRNAHSPKRYREMIPPQKVKQSVDVSFIEEVKLIKLGLRGLTIRR